MYICVCICVCLYTYKYTQSCTRGFGCHWVPAYTGLSPHWYTHASNHARKVLVVTWCLQTRGFWLSLGAYRGMGKTPAPPHPPYNGHTKERTSMESLGEWLLIGNYIFKFLHVKHIPPGTKKLKYCY